MLSRRLPAGLGAPCRVEAWINTVGTRRAWRGKGVARWLMTDVHQRIAAADDGFERAILGVDAENPTGALRVYRRLGLRGRPLRDLAHPDGWAAAAEDAQSSIESMRRALPRMIFSTTSGATPSMSSVATSLVSGHVESVWG